MHDNNNIISVTRAVCEANYTRGDGDGGVNLLQRNARRRCSAKKVFKGGLVAANGFRCMVVGAMDVYRFGECKCIFGGRLSFLELKMMVFV